MANETLSNYVCKIEGHGKLKIDQKKNQVKLEIDEGERLFERLVLNKPYLDAPFITARICGVCPTAHTLAAIAAIEDAFEVKVTPNIVALRAALLAGQIIQSHALHLYFLALPDYVDALNALELHKTKPEIFANAVALKKLGDKVVEIIGGRAVHPTAPTVGGFLSVPDKKILKTLAEELSSHLNIALDTVELFAGFKYPALKREKTEYLATQKDNTLNYLDGGLIVSNRNLKSPVQNYPYAFKEEIRNDSPTKYGTRDGHGFMVGALARLSLDDQHLNPKAAYAYTEIWGKKFPTYNPFHNNVAQAIEIVHLIEEATNKLNEVINDRNEIFKVPYAVKAGQGFGAIEAPRGTLYHGVRIDNEGFITLYDIVTPTVQNLVNLEEDAAELVKKHANLSSKKLTEELEMLIRAYDPCITCSVH